MVVGIWQEKDGAPYRAFLQLKERRALIEFPAGLTIEQCQVLLDHEQHLATTHETATHAFEVEVKKKQETPEYLLEHYRRPGYRNYELRRENHKIAFVVPISEDAVHIIWEKLQ